jgi:hypothetical protein
MEMALAKSLINKLGDDLDVGRSWAKLSAPTKKPVIEPAKPKVFLNLKPKPKPVDEPRVSEPRPQLALF